MPRLAIPLVWLLACAPAAALVGGAAPAPDYANTLALIAGSRGNSCTGTLIAADLVLTAAHCVPSGADYKIVSFESGQPALRDIARVERHPQFSQQAFDNHRATADVALLKLATPLAKPAPAPLFSGRLAVSPGDRFYVVGYGLSERGNGKSGGTLRAAELAATGRPGNLQIRLFDPVARNERAGLGACTGDSGAPVFTREAGRVSLLGVVSWSTGPGNSEGCGGLTGVTPLPLYRAWIVETARKLGSALAP